METSREFAERYLFMVLGDRKGCNIRDIIQNEKIVEEIVQELTGEIIKRDKQIANEFC